MRYSMSEETINSILNRLGKMPYAEIFNLIGLIQSDCKPIDTQAKILAEDEDADLESLGLTKAI